MTMFKAKQWVDTQSFWAVSIMKFVVFPKEMCLHSIVSYWLWPMSHQYIQIDMHIYIYTLGNLSSCGYEGLRITSTRSQIILYTVDISKHSLGIPSVTSQYLPMTHRFFHCGVERKYNIQETRFESATVLCVFHVYICIYTHTWIRICIHTYYISNELCFSKRYVCVCLYI